jgi:hypothetical protein
VIKIAFSEVGELLASYIHEAFGCNYADKCDTVQLFEHDSDKAKYEDIKVKLNSWNVLC